MDGDRPPTLNTADLVLTVLFTFFWLCAASSLAWAKGQLISFTVQEVIRIQVILSFLPQFYRTSCSRVAYKSSAPKRRHDATRRVPSSPSSPRRLRSAFSTYSSGAPVHGELNMW